MEQALRLASELLQYGASANLLYDNIKNSDLFVWKGNDAWDTAQWMHCAHNAKGGRGSSPNKKKQNRSNPAPTAGSATPPPSKTTNKRKTASATQPPLTKTTTKKRKPVSLDPSPTPSPVLVATAPEPARNNLSKKDVAQEQERERRSMLADRSVVPEGLTVLQAVQAFYVRTDKLPPSKIRKLNPALMVRQYVPARSEVYYNSIVEQKQWLPGCAALCRIIDPPEEGKEADTFDGQHRGVAAEKATALIPTLLETVELYRSDMPDALCRALGRYKNQNQMLASDMSDVDSLWSMRRVVEAYLDNVRKANDSAKGKRVKQAPVSLGNLKPKDLLESMSAEGMLVGYVPGQKNQNKECTRAMNVLATFQCLVNDGTYDVLDELFALSYLDHDAMVAAVPGFMPGMDPPNRDAKGFFQINYHWIRKSFNLNAGEFCALLHIAYSHWLSGKNMGAAQFWLEMAGLQRASSSSPSVDELAAITTANEKAESELGRVQDTLGVLKIVEDTATDATNADTDFRSLRSFAKLKALAGFAARDEHAKRLLAGTIVNMQRILRSASESYDKAVEVQVSGYLILSRQRIGGLDVCLCGPSKLADFLIDLADFAFAFCEKGQGVSGLSDQRLAGGLVLLAGRQGEVARHLHFDCFVVRLACRAQDALHVHYGAS